MRLQPKLLKKFFRFLFPLLWRRLKIIAEQRYALGIFLVAMALVPIPWFFGGKGLEYIPLLFIFGFAGFCGLLRYPKRDPEDHPKGRPNSQRKNIRHPFPPSLFWAIQLNGWIGLVVLSIVPFDLFAKSLLKIPLTTSLSLSLLSLSATLLPTFVVFTPSFLFRLFRVVRIRLPRIKPVHFYTALIMVGGLIALGLIGFFIAGECLQPGLIGAGIVVLACLGPLAVRVRVFQRAYPGYSVGIPNLAYWGIVALVVLALVHGLVLGSSVRLNEEVILFLFGGLGILYLLYLPYGIVVGYFKADLVPPVQGKGRDSALSIQSTPGLYIDQQGYGARIRQFIDTSDGGVIGVTGVRGAGKSALIGHVLSTLESKYFTLPLTAPVKHEGGLSFFMAVCRSVCGRVLRDTEPILYGRKTKERQALFEIFGYVRNGLLGVFLVGAGILFITPDWRMWLEKVFQPRGELISSSESVFVSPTEALEAEKRFVQNSLSQLDSELGKGEGLSKKLPYPEYILVPTYGKSGISLLPKRTDVSVKRQLEGLLTNYTRPSQLLSRLFKKFGPSGVGKIILLEKVFGVQKRTIERAYGISLDNEDFMGEAQFVLNVFISKIYSSPYISAGLNHHLPLLQKHLGYLASNPSGETSKEQKELPRLASSLFFQAFTDAKETLAYNQKRLKELRTLLSTYQYILEGKPAARVSFLGSQAGQSSWFVTALRENQGLVLVVLLVLLVFGLGGKLW